MSNPAERLVLITGATGYVGGRLASGLIARGERVRCLARRPEALADRLTAHSEVVQGDLLDAPSLDRALVGVDTAYYLVHSLGTGSYFETTEAEAARNFAVAAKAAGVQRVIYLGGLCDEGRLDLSLHLRSRCRVGEMLREHGVQTIEFRASVILGSGSLSFELIRALVQRLPIMITPKWVSVQAQPHRRFPGRPRLSGPGAGLRSDPAHRGRDRLVLRELAMASAGSYEPPRGWRRHGTRAPGFGIASRWRRGGLLAC